METDFFEQIDSEPKAYWFGFTTADGCLVHTGNRVSYTLSARDKIHLEKLASIYQRPVYESEVEVDGKKHKMCSLQINGRTCWQSLASNGLCPRKSLEPMTTVIAHVPPALHHHFVRGYFDGDGTINSNRLTTVFQIVGPEPFLAQIKEVMLGELPLNDNKIVPDGSIWKLGWSGASQLSLIRDWLYRDATVWLERKRDRFNLVNAYKTRGSSKYRGVSWIAKRKRWQAMVRIEGWPKFLGLFEAEEDAAAAYDRAIREHGLPLHKLNFGNEE